MSQHVAEEMPDEDKDFYEAHKRATAKADQSAMTIVIEMDLPKEYQFHEDHFGGLNGKIKNKAKDVLRKLKEGNGERTGYLLGIAKREVSFALLSSSEYIRIMKEAHHMGSNKYTERLSTPQGYGDENGVAATLYDHLANIEESSAQAEFRKGTPFESRCSPRDLLLASSIHFFAAASECHRNAEIEVAHDWIHEAYDALEIECGIRMWDFSEAEALGGEKSLNKARSELARNAAMARHREHHAMKADLFSWLEKNMKNYESVDAAAEDAMRLMPVKFRTAGKWITQWKKLRSASKV